MRHIKLIWLASLLASFTAAGCAPAALSPWIKVDDFEASAALKGWTHADVQNDTNPFIPNPQVAEIRPEGKSANHYLLKKPAPDGIVGNRKALGFKALPRHVALGETFTFYTRINVEYFPNNHSFGLSNLDAPQILEQNYNAFEPMIRITDKAETDGSRNDGTLMVLSGYKKYSKIQNPQTQRPANPLKPDTWYELWYVVNNAPQAQGGQSYDLYVRGGEFASQQPVFKEAVFRIKREAALKYFITIANTGPHARPYGNGGIRYDDIYMRAGKHLSSPVKASAP